MQITIKELKKMISEAVNECYHDMGNSTNSQYMVIYCSEGLIEIYPK